MLIYLKLIINIVEPNIL